MPKIDPGPQPGNRKRYGIESHPSRPGFFLAYDNSSLETESGFIGRQAAPMTVLSRNTFPTSSNTEKAFTPRLRRNNQSGWSTCPSTIPGGVQKILLKSRPDFRPFRFIRSGNQPFGLYPRSWTSGPWRTADNDKDGKLDWIDGDDDNDGICDRQEDRQSSPEMNPPFFYSPWMHPKNPRVTLTVT